MRETDASNQAIAGILSQYYSVNGAKQLHHIEYHAKTLSASQPKWPIHDKELFAIVASLHVTGVLFTYQRTVG